MNTSQNTSSEAANKRVASELILTLGLLMRRLRTEAHPGDLNLSQASVLARLDREGPLTTAELARAEAMKPQSMKTLLAALEEEECVERQPHPTDGRQILFRLTPKGLEARQQRSQAKLDWITCELNLCAPEEIQALMAALPVIQKLGRR